MYQLVLASSSPRRKDLLLKEGYFFTTDPVDVSENLNKNINLEDALKKIAEQKVLASHWVQKQGQFLIVGADTSVVLGDKVLGKPVNQDECRSFLKLLSGKKHEVKTAWAVLNTFNGEVTSHLDTVTICFKKLEDSQIFDYVSSGEGLDKAGGYGIQGRAFSFVEAIEGEIDTVIGFPIRSFQSFLQKNKISIPRWVVVSKGRDVEEIQKIKNKGYAHFGESYMQEALNKIYFFSEKKIKGIYWHFVGRLQTNKVRDAVKYFECIHSVDRLHLAEKISTTALSLGICKKIFVQVNIGEDPQKAGILPRDFKKIFPQILQLKGLKVLGLMTMPPLCKESQLRLYFQAMKELSKKWSQALGYELFLSMGTSKDYLIALEEGATHIRVGRALFESKNGSNLSCE